MKIQVIQLIMASLLFSGSVYANDEHKTALQFEVAIEKTDVNCPGEATGSAELIITGDSGPYVISWSTGATTSKIENLLAGTYIVEVGDAEGKNLIKGVTINEPQVLQVAFDNRNIFCHGESDGQIDLTVSGGVAPYTYQWSSGDTSQDLENIGAGEYFVTIIDANNCSKEFSTIISEPSELAIAFSKASASCYGVSDGLIDVAVFGGTLPYFYNWSNGATSEDLFDLSAGEYTITVTDGNNCQVQEIITIDSPETINADMETIPVSCNGSDGKINLTVSGGTSPFTYKWSNSSVVINQSTRDISDLPVDNYTVEITDANGCTFSTSGEISESPVIEIIPEVTGISCIAQNDGRIGLNITGGKAPYSFQWSNGSTEKDIEALNPGTYSVLVADAGGCTSISEIQIVEPKDLIFEILPTPASCPELNDGAIDLFVGGGTSPYQYEWSNGATSESLENLPADNYTVIVTDANGCQKEKTTALKNKNALCINVPSAFSPNGDTMNDTWILAQSQTYPNIKVKVFNRWGKVLFSSTGYGTPWDGSYNGKIVPAGTYYYTIDLGTAGQAEAGSVTIIK